jgi:hypothetical protein
MSIVDWFKGRVSKHQVHQRKHVKGRRRNMNTAAKATVNPAGTKLLKRFAKHLQPPRGY